MPYQSESINLQVKQETKPIKILLVKSQNWNRELEFLNTESKLEIIGSFGDSQSALEQLETIQPQIVLFALDRLEEALFAIETIALSDRQIEIAIVSNCDRQETIAKALKAGVKGYVLKNTPAKELVEAIEAVSRGYLHLAPEILNKLDSPGAIVPARASSDLTPSSKEAALSQDWSPATEELLDALPKVWTRGILYLLAVFTAIALPWSMLAKVDETGTARGRLEPKEKIVELDAPVAGTIAAVKVEEGQEVSTGQTLVELESNLIRAELQELKTKYSSQKEQLMQLELLQNQSLLSLRTQQQQNQAQQLEKLAQVEQARQNLDALKALRSLQKEEKLAQVEQARQAIDATTAAHQLAEIRVRAAKEKIPRYRRAYQQGVIARERLEEVEQMARENAENLTQARSEIEQARSRVREQQTSYDKLNQEAESEIEQALLRLQEQQNSHQSLIQSGKLSVLKIEEQLKDLESRISTLKSDITQSESQIESLKFQLEQRSLEAPANGTVFHLPVKGAGKVVQPGEKIVKIAPNNSPLVLRAQIATSESGFLKVGMPVKVKFDAYPFQDYGIVPGRVSWIAPDSKTDETQSGAVETFELKIVLQQHFIGDRHEPIALTPGQTATAEIVVRQRRVIDIILDPFKKLQKGGLEI